MFEVAYAGDQWGPPEEDGGWYAANALAGNYATSSDPSAIAALVCVRQDRQVVGNYDQLAPAYRLTWTAMAVDWPAGDLWAWTQLSGGEPPPRMPAGQAGYGATPAQEFASWLARQLGD